jgi:hypothetical protein
MAALVRRGASTGLALCRLRSALPRLMQPRAAMLHTSGGATTAATIASGSVTAAVTAGVTGVTAGVMAAYGLRAVAVSCDSSSADPWVAYVDVASGRTYFHNAEAQQTVWEKPPADAPVSPLSFERETATVSPGPKLANGEPPGTGLPKLPQISWLSWRVWRVPPIYMGLGFGLQIQFQS